jgi:hypothetical protein
MVGMLGACRCQATPPRAVNWKPATIEAASLLMLEEDGNAKLVCLPRHPRDRQLSLGVALSRILDVGWKGGLLVAGWAADSADPDQSSGDELVLFAPNVGPRRISKGVRTARFSSDGAALAYEVTEPRDSSAGLTSATSYVLDLDTGKVTALGALADPLWEADGKHLRATRLRTGSDEGAQWSSLRVRWERESGTVTMDGPGSAQIPAPVGEMVAWSEDQRGVPVPNYCTVRLGRGMVKHLVVGQFCMAIADDRSVRWSPDGRWLAFPHPGPIPGDPGGEFIDVVGIEGGRYPALSALSVAQARARPEQPALVTGPGSVWFDWSPSQRFLAIQDGAGALSVGDFQAGGIAFLGQGERPMWSPGGAYLLALASGQGAPRNRSTSEAFALTGVAPSERIDLGAARDGRWLPAHACDE